MTFYKFQQTTVHFIYVCQTLFGDNLFILCYFKLKPTNRIIVIFGGRSKFISDSGQEGDKMFAEPKDW